MSESIPAQPFHLFPPSVSLLPDLVLIGFVPVQPVFSHLMVNFAYLSPLSRCCNICSCLCTTEGFVLTDPRNGGHIN